MSRPTLNEVARRAGVSKKTVSNVINDFQFVSAATRQRVQAAIDELGYRPNLSARNLARGRAGMIALAIPELDKPYFAELARYVIEEAARHSWVVLIEQTNYSRDREEAVLSGDLLRRVDGLLFSPTELGADELSGHDLPVPVVLLGERIVDGPADHVGIDNVAAAKEATAHLTALGRRRIAAIGRHPGVRRVAPALRMRGYQLALADAQLPLDPSLVRDAHQHSGEVGAAAMAELLDFPDPPDAVFCVTDLLAMGALRVLAERGRRVPEDVAVVGFDDIVYGRLIRPSLTTIRPDKRRIAALAVDLLAQRSQERVQSAPRQLTAGYELVPRESTTGW